MPERRTRLSFPDPPSNRAAGLAHKLDHGNPLDREIMLLLVGRPHRYAEFVPLLRGKGDNNLTQALRRLRDHGLIQMRTHFRTTPRFDYYELTELGIDVVLGLAERRTLDRLADLIRDPGLRDAALST